MDRTYGGYDPNNLMSALPANNNPELPYFRLHGPSRPAPASRARR
jgi:hypothetical protein